MTDVHSPEVRAKNMRAIRSKNSKPELQIRRGLHASGIRFRLHDKKLPGSPDLVLRKYKTVIFVHGCFWHGHDCKYFKLPMTRTEFWQLKIQANRQRDSVAIKQLGTDGWNVIVVWECALRTTNYRTTELVRKISQLLNDFGLSSSPTFAEISM